MVAKLARNVAGELRVLLPWTALMLAGLLLSVFLHEVAHGIGARLQGIHVSTGFNRVGNWARRPGDPDFRTNLPDSALGLALGPIVTLVSASALARWFFTGRSARTPAFALGAAALSDAWIRALPMLLVVAKGLAGGNGQEDEVMLGVLMFGSSFLRWIPVGVSLGVSFGCLVAVYDRLIQRFCPLLRWRAARLAFLLAPAFVYPALAALTAWLDETVRLNW